MIFYISVYLNIHLSLCQQINEKMKTILLPTDFSETANKALDYAIKLALKFEAKLHILNTYEMPHTGTTMLVSIEDLLEKESLKELEKLEAKLKNEHPGLNFKTIAKAGSVADVVNKYTTTNDIDLVLMGTTGASGFSGQLFGSNTANLIRNVKTPLVVIPHEAEQCDPCKIAISTDFKFGVDDDIYNSIRQIALAYGSKINFINVTDKYKEEELAAIEKDFGCDIDFVYGHDIEEGIREYLDDKKVDMIVFVAEKHGIFHSIFKPSISKTMAKELKIPMMILAQ